MTNSTDLATLATRAKAVYNQHGPAFDQQRPRKLHEKKYLDRFAALLPDGGNVLDAGCGGGEPFIPWFLTRGFTVEGLDFAKSMLHLAQSRFPQLKFHACDMSTMQIGKTFDGILAWNSFFHLPQKAQHEAMGRFAAHLKPRGVLMLTVGPRAGETVGQVNGAKVYHASLSPDDYRLSLEKLSIEVIEFVAEDEECDLQTVLIGRKVGQDLHSNLEILHELVHG